MTNCSIGFEIAFAQELAAMMPVNIGPMMRSPTNSWLPNSVTSPLIGSPTFIAPNQANGTRMRSPTSTSERPIRHQKRLSLAFFKGSATEVSDKKSTKTEFKSEKAVTAEETMDAASTTTSSRSRSKDRSRANRLSLNFLAPMSSPVEALPAFPVQQPRKSSSRSRSQSRGQSMDSRPETSRSMTSESSENKKKGSSVRKRLSLLHIGKKSSKGSVRGRDMNDTLMEE
jgi:dedicator of cytokinesis protein 3